MLDIIDNVLKQLDGISNKESTKIVFTDKQYASIPLAIDNFHEISERGGSDRRILFVDGGNNTLLQSSNFIVSFIRLYACLYEGNKKLNEEKHEFFAVVTTEYSADSDAGQKLQFKTQLFPVGSALMPYVDDLSFDSMDSSIKEGVNRASISKIVDCVRRFGELNLAAKMSFNLNTDDIIILDGILQATVTNEERYLDLLYKVCEEKNIAVCGLAKTSRLFTDSGDNALVVLDKMSRNNSMLGKWYYHPFVEINNKKHKADMFIAKFHSDSEYVFRFEVHDSKKQDLKELFSLIASLSKDPVFLGYPYGLIEADRNARVSNEERNYLKTIFDTKRDLNAYVKSLDAHTVLDTIG
jgi:hypothetical protein